MIAPLYHRADRTSAEPERLRDNRTMDQRIADFLNFLAVEKNASNNTIAAYRNDLGQFQKSICAASSNGTDPWPSVSGNDVVSFVSELRKRQYKDSTLARKIAAVKSFFGFLVAEGLVEGDPTEQLKSPQVGKSLPKALTVEEMDRLLEQPARKNTPESSDTPPPALEYPRNQFFATRIRQPQPHLPH